MKKSTLLKKKICLLGSFGVGKTSLIERFVHNRFEEKYLTTLGVRISQKILPPVKNSGDGLPKQYYLLIWDIAGLEKFDSVVKNYFRGAAGALAVADLTRPETFEGLLQNVNRFLKINPEAKIGVLGNKVDLLPTKESIPIHLKEIAQGLNTEALSASAKTGENVEAAFLSLAKML